MENIWGFTADPITASHATRGWKPGIWCLSSSHPSSTQIVNLCPWHIPTHCFQIHCLYLSEGSQTSVTRNYPLSLHDTSWDPIQRISRKAWDREIWTFPEAQIPMWDPQCGSSPENWEPMLYCQGLEPFVCRMGQHHPFPVVPFIPGITCLRCTDF